VGAAIGQILSLPVADTGYALVIGVGTVTAVAARRVALARP
jgi:hypothetical protein